MNTPIANMIAEMHGKGIPVELIVSTVARFEEAMAARAVSTISPVDTSTIDKRRAWDRERKRRQRELERLAEMSAISTGHPPDSAGIPPDAASILTFLSGSPTEEVKEKKESKRNARGTRIPPDFSIDDEDRKFAAGLGIPPDAVEAETPQFIDYWISVPGARGLKLNWKATWRNRMRDIAKYRAARSGGKPLTEFQLKQRKTNDVTEQLKQSALAERSGGAPDRFLSYDHSERS